MEQKEPLDLSVRLSVSVVKEEEDEEEDDDDSLNDSGVLNLSIKHLRHNAPSMINLAECISRGATATASARARARARARVRARAQGMQ